MFYKHWNEVKEWRWTLFRPQAIASHGDGSLLVHEPSLDMLERLLAHVPTVINCGYRDPVHNAAVGGEPLSEHKQGRAFDLSIRGCDRQALHNAAVEAGFTGFGYYHTFHHVDTGRRRHWGSW